MPGLKAVVSAISREYGRSAAIPEGRHGHRCSRTRGGKRRRQAGVRRRGEAAGAAGAAGAERGRDGLDATGSSRGCGATSRRRRRPRWSSSTSRSCARRSPTAATARRSSRAGAATSCGSATASCDARRFEQLVAAGAAARGAALWRGAPLADVADEPFAAAEIRRLEELRLIAALELAIDGDLAAGRHREVARRARGAGRASTRCASGCTRSGCSRCTAAAGRPRRSRPTARRAAALVEEIGVEPGPELRRLHEAILRQDPALEPPAAEPVELPPELDARHAAGGPRGRARLRCASSGGARTAAPAGLCWSRAPRGMGKTRLAAELAGEVHRDARRGAATRPGRASRRRRSRRWPARGSRGGRRCWCSTTSTAPADEARTALGELVGGVAALPVLVLATAEDAGLAAGLGADATIVLAPLGRRRRARGGAALRGRARGRGSARRAARRGERRRAAAPAPRRGRVGARARPSAGWRTPPVASRPSAPCCARRRTTWSATSSSCRRRATAPSGAGRGRGRRRLPVQGSRLLRRGRRRRSSSGASGSWPRWSRG